jgi:lipid-A-disaccharide synthase
MLQAAALINKAIPQTQFLLPLASTAPRALVEEMVEKNVEQPPPAVLEQARAPAPHFPGLPLKIIEGQSYAALAAAHLAVVASGTATVEAALAATPSIIIYRVSPLTFAVARRLVRVRHAGMANLLAGETLFPELLQDDFTPARLAREVLSLVGDPKRLEDMRRGLTRIRERLGGPGASRRAARVALEIMAASGNIARRD